jgi:tetratricopeptide (TPR) repeat protein
MDHKQTNINHSKFYILIVVVTFIIYGNSIKNNYALDDNYVTTTNPQEPNQRIQEGLKGIPDIFTSHYVESTQQSFEYRPIVLATFAVEYQFFGSNPQVSHFINIVLYAVTCVLLFIILSTLLSSYHIVFPLLITFLFLAHPIHTEVVNNLKSRDELLSFLFGLCSLYFFIKKVNDGKLKYVFLAIFFLLLALLSKLTAVLFFVLIPLTLYFFTSLKIKKLLMYFAIPLIAYIGFVVLKYFLLKGSVSIREFAFFENPLFYELDFWRRIPFAIYTAGYYIKLLVFPHPLSCYYGYNTILFADWSFVFVWLSLLFHGSIGIYALVKLPKKSIISYGIIIYLIGIFPFINLWTPVVGIIGERFIYFASLGFCIGIAYLLLVIFKVDVKNGTNNFRDKKWKNFNGYFKTTCIFILVIYSFKSFSRNPVWKDKLTLFQNDVKHMEDSYFLNYFTASTLNDQLSSIPFGREKDQVRFESQTYFKAATEILKEGLKTNISDYYTMSTLGTIYVNYLNDVDAAIPWFKKSLEINPDYDVAKYNLIFCYEKRNMPDSALSQYEKMITEGTKYLPVYFQLHELYLLKKDYTKAININKNILLEYPKEIKLYINLGNSYILKGDTLNGLRYFEEAAIIPPLDYVLLQNVANVFLTTGDTLKAMKYEEKSKNVKRKSRIKFSSLAK